MPSYVEVMVLFHVGCVFMVGSIVIECNITITSVADLPMYVMQDGANYVNGVCLVYVNPKGMYMRVKFFTREKYMKACIFDPIML